jgi:hypothetical protein
MRIELPKLFEKPVFVDFYVDEQERMIYFAWDFGMRGKFSLDTLFLDIYKINDPIEAVIEICKFDLDHAFEHCQEDPNYTEYHWALYGNLKDRKWISRYEN